MRERIWSKLGAERDAFWNSLSNAHARIYFGGHDHFYDHARLDDGDGNPDNDIHQIIVGTGGALLYPDGVFNGTNGVWTPVRVFHEAQFGFLLVEVNNEQVRTTWFHRVGPGDYEPGGNVFTYSLGPRPVLASTYTGGNLGDGAIQDAVIAARPVLSRIEERVVKVSNRDVRVKEYPANSMEDAIVAAVMAEKDGALAIVCAPIVAPTIQKILTIPVSIVIPRDSIVRAIEVAAQKTL